MPGAVSDSSTPIHLAKAGHECIRKLEVLKTVYPDEAEFDRLLAKVLEAVLADYRGRLRRYEAELAQFESRYGMRSDTFIAPAVL